MIQRRRTSDLSQPLLQNCRLFGCQLSAVRLPSRTVILLHFALLPRSLITDEVILKRLIFFFLYTAPPPPGQLRLTVQLQHDVQQNVTFKFNYSVPLESELEKIEFFTTNLRNGRWILAVAKYVIRGESVFSYRVREAVVRRLHPQGIYKYSYNEDLKVLKTRLTTENDREAKFTLRNVIMKDQGSYSCKIALRNGKNLFYWANLVVIPGA